MRISLAFYCRSLNITFYCLFVPIVLGAQAFTLSAGDYDACTNTLPISWEAYDQWPGGVERYEIWASEKSPASDYPGPAELVDSVTGAVTAFDFSAPEGRQHCIEIWAIAVNTPDTVTSSLLCIDLPLIPVAESIVIEGVSVTSGTEYQPGTAFVTWELRPLAVFSELLLLRSKNGGDFEMVRNLNPVDQSFSDLEAEADQFSVRYQIRGTDQCGREIISNIAASIFLEGEIDKDGNGLLTWTPYENEYLLDGLSYHVITDRTNNSSLNYQNPAASYPGHIRQHETALENPDGGAGDFCFRVLVEPRLLHKGLIYFNALAFSNEVCLRPSTPLFIPNAFAPGSVNAEFKPLGSMDGITSYSMLIFDRYGSLLFESQDITLGWDGTSDGQAVPTGAYVYFIQIQQNDDALINKKGSVMLMR